MPDEVQPDFLVILREWPQPPPQKAKVAPFVVTIPPSAPDDHPRAQRAMVVFFNRERAERFLMAELPNGRPFFPRGTIRGLRPQRFRRLLEAYPESNERLDSLLMEPSPIPTWASDSDEELQGDLVPIDLAIEGLDELIKKGYT